MSPTPSKGFKIHVGKDVISALKISSPAISQDLLEKISPALKDFGLIMKRMAEQTPPALRILAKHGWYVPFNSIPKEIFDYANDLEQGKEQEVNDTLMKVFSSSRNNIISRACKSFPAYKKLLLEAKLAHNKGMFYASTILFLTCADGILNGNLYENKKLKEELKKRGIAINTFVEFLTEKMAITQHHTPGKQSDTLKRHAVMHGLDPDYGTKLNSLKALSLLDYVAIFVL